MQVAWRGVFVEVAIEVNFVADLAHLSVALVRVLSIYPGVSDMWHDLCVHIFAYRLAHGHGLEVLQLFVRDRVAFLVKDLWSVGVTNAQSDLNSIDQRLASLAQARLLGSSGQCGQPRIGEGFSQALAEQL